jgi:hypothetical protein
MSTSHPAPLSEVSATFLVELRAVRAWAVYAGDTRKAVLAGMLLMELETGGGPVEPISAAGPAKGRPLPPTKIG